MIVARGLGRGDAQVLVAWGLGRRVIREPAGESAGKRKRAPGWARADVSAPEDRRLREDDDLLLILLAGALQAGLLE